MLSTAVTAGRLNFTNPLVMGAGCCKTLEDITRASKSAIAGMELGTITWKGLPGNPGNNFYAHFVRGVLIYTQNSLGMPNPGKAAVTEFAQDAIRIAHEHGKLIGINVAGDTIQELIEMILWAASLGFDWITINPACPNKFVNGKPASLLYYDFVELDQFFRELDSHFTGHTTEIWFKLTPDNNTLGYQLKVLDQLVETRAITGIVANNTVPHTLSFNETFKPTIAMRLGGMGGPAVMPKAIGDIDRLKTRHANRFVLIGAGGATYGRNIAEFQHAGASIVQATSVWWANEMNFRVFGDMLAEYAEYLGVQ